MWEFSLNTLFYTMKLEVRMVGYSEAVKSDGHVTSQIKNINYWLEIIKCD